MTDNHSGTEDFFEGYRQGVSDGRRDWRVWSSCLSIMFISVAATLTWLLE
jgi:hypothetical protein